MQAFERTRETYRLSTDPSVMNVDAVHAYLSRSYWAEGVPKEIVAKALAGSLSFALLDEDKQIGLARVVTDGATFAYLCDVYVLEDYRGRGLGKWMIGEMMSHPDLQGLRRFVLVTRDAHKLYERVSFRPIENVAGYMEIVRKNPYTQQG